MMGTDKSLPSDERLRKLERLIDASCGLCSSVDLEPFLHSLIAAASELTGCEAASILEPDENEGQLRFLATPWFQREALKSVKVPLKNSIAGLVFETGQPLIVPDTSLEPRHFKGADLASRFATRSLMAVPIIYQGQRLGVFESMNKIGGARYTEEDRYILESLSCQAAVAIQNTHLMDRIQQIEDAMSQLNEMKSDFIGIASHELRTPLGLILGHATFLKEAVRPEQQPQLEIIIRNSFRLKEIIDRIANMDDVQRGMVNIRACPVAIRQMVEEVMDSFRQEAERRNISLEADLGPPDLMVECDTSRISIALSNLVQNALIFSNPQGHVFISVQQIPGHAKVSVIDDGIGIPAKDLPHVFERFYQVETHLARKHGGMGLGLSVARVMVEMHGGRIWVESTENKGSNFTFILPASSSLPNEAGSPSSS